MSSDPPVVLVRGERVLTYLIGADTILELRGKAPNDFDFVTDRPGHDLRYAIDIARLRTELGWHPTYSDFRAGLTATIDWYRHNEDWWRPQKDATEAVYAGTERVVTAP